MCEHQQNERLMCKSYLWTVFLFSEGAMILHLSVILILRRGYISEISAGKKNHNSDKRLGGRGEAV